MTGRPAAGTIAALNDRITALEASEGMLKLEMKGLSKSRGPSAYSTLKSVYGYTGTREAVLKELDARRDALLNYQPEGEMK